jgi:hypothetical protein
MPQRGHGDGRLIRWRSQARRMLGEPTARWDARGELAAATAQVLGERVPGGQSAWTGGGLAPPGQGKARLSAGNGPPGQGVPVGSDGVRAEVWVPRITCPRCCQPHHRRRKRTPQFSHLCPVLTPHRLIISIRVFRTAAEADQVIADLAARFLHAAAHRARQPPVGLHPAPALASVYDLTSPSARAACGAVPHTPGSVPDTRNRPADHQPRSTRELRRPRTRGTAKS